MKTKIFDTLKQTFAGKYGVGDEVLRGYADSLAATGLVTDENLATVVQGQENALRAYQVSFDKMRGEKSTLQKEIDELKAKQATGGEPKPQPKNDDQTPDWAKSILESNEALKKEVATIRGEKVLESRKTKLEAIIAKLPENLRKPYARISISPDMSDEDFATMTAEITTEVEGLLADTATRGATFGRPMGGGSSSVKATDADKPSAQETDAVANAMGLK